MMVHIEVDKFNQTDLTKICESLEKGEDVTFNVKSNGIYDPVLDMEIAHYVYELETKYGSSLMHQDPPVGFDSYRSYKLRK